MPWTPQNDFEEEILKLQPDHDFIFGYLSEPQHPRPTTHTNYATARKLQEVIERKESGVSSAISSKLRMIQQVQSIANSKPVGQQPCLDDWDTNENLERETIGMMRHFGMGANVEQPLNEEVTISPYPINNTTKFVRSGGRTRPLFLDDNVFKLREKVSPSSECESSSQKRDKDDSVGSEMEGATSLNTSSSLSFNTAVEDCGDSFSSAASCVKTPSKIANRELYQYDKLLEDTSSLSLDSSSKSSSRSLQDSCESFKAFRRSSWVPVLEDDDEVLFNKKENWPSLSKTGSSSDVDSAKNNDSADCIFNETKPKKKEDFLDRLLNTIKTELDTNEDIISDSSSISSDQKPKPSKPPKTPKTYASITKAPKSSEKTENKKKSVSLNSDIVFPTFYTTRKMYALKRNPK